MVVGVNLKIVATVAVVLLFYHAKTNIDDQVCCFSPKVLI